jgi:hypothetical protein
MPIQGCPYPLRASMLRLRTGSPADFRKSRENRHRDERNDDRFSRDYEVFPDDP